MSRFDRQMKRRTATRQDGPTPRKRKKRRVLQRPPGVDRFGSRSRSRPEAGDTQLWARFQANSKEGHPVVCLTDEGIDWGREPQPGDEIGYGMDRHDDCFQAAVATVTRVPVEQVPDLLLDERFHAGANVDELSLASWQRIEKWATQHGLTLLFHLPSELPVPGRWIGVIPGPPPEVVTYRGVTRMSSEFGDHCLVMSDDRLIFDPSCSAAVPPGSRLMRFHPEQIHYGISFQPKEEQ